MPFQTMSMTFYEDGLQSEHCVFKSNDSDECYQKALDLMEDSPEDFRVVEVDDDGKYVYEQHPYPRVREPEPPAFYMARMRQDKPFRWQRGESAWQNIDFDKIDFSKVLVQLDDVHRKLGENNA